MGKNSNIFVSFDEARSIVLSSVKKRGNERLPFENIYGRILQEDVRSEYNIPPLNNSAMDGFAVRWTDTVDASLEHPVELTVTGEVRAGGLYANLYVEEHTALRIMTGAPIPEGADAVIPVENTREDTVRGVVAVLKKSQLHENIRFAGEDVKAGQIVLEAGTIMRSADIGLLAAVNKREVSVYSKPTVAIISTGDEIAEVGADLAPGQIRNSNAYSLQSEIAKYNGVPVYYGIAKDSLSETRKIFLRALEHDIVISTGGVSMGKYDLVKNVLNELGVDILFETIKMKPGKPVVFGVRDNTLVFGLPGNPVSTLVSFIEFVRPALLKMSGAKNLNKPEVLAICDNDIYKKSGRKEFIRGFFHIKEGVINVTTTGPQGSGILRSMSVANCLIIMNEESSGCRKGDQVIIQLIDHEEIA